MSIPLEVETPHLRRFFIFAGLLLVLPAVSTSQTPSEPEDRKQETARAQATENPNPGPVQPEGSGEEPSRSAAATEYRIGANDVVEIKVFDAPELNGKFRVSTSGEISAPLLGTAQAGGLTARELEGVLESRLREYMKDPHVGVFVTTMESHPVSVVGAVKKPGVFQVRGPKSVLEMISMAEGLADDAGDSVLVMRGAGLGSSSHPGVHNQEAASDVSKIDHDTLPSDINASAGASGREQTERINLKNLMQSENPQFNVAVYPGDIVKVARAGVVYVVGEVKKPGGFVMKSDERMSVLKAIALAEGLTPTSAKSGARIIRPDSHGEAKDEIPINLGKILAGKAPDPTLSAADIVFVPNSTGKTATYKGSQAVISALVSLMIFRW
jgi:polysaccharide biosynthesis/export protein